MEGRGGGENGGERRQRKGERVVSEDRRRSPLLVRSWDAGAGLKHRVSRVWRL